MTPERAKEVLDEMKVTELAGLDGRFRIARLPRKGDIGTFVRAVKTLGSWSVETTASKPRVRVETGYSGSDLIFKMEDKTE